MLRKRSDGEYPYEFVDRSEEQVAGLTDAERQALEKKVEHQLPPPEPGPAGKAEQTAAILEGLPEGTSSRCLMHDLIIDGDGGPKPSAGEEVSHPQKPGCSDDCEAHKQGKRNCHSCWCQGDSEPVVE